MGDAARTQDANISKLATALAEYYQDALDKELKSTKAEATEASTNTKKAISAWIIANPLANFKSIVGLELNLIDGQLCCEKANKIEQADANKLLELGASAGDIPYESWKKASTKVFGDKFIVIMNLEELLCQLIWFLRKLMAIDWQQNCKMVTMELLVSLFMQRQKLHV
ncbi:MAG: hypothetical protein V8Q99_09690 [Bacteroides ovatus]